MGRRIGLVLLVLFAGCDAEVTRVRTKEPQSREPVPAPEPTEPKPKDPTGPLPKPDPTYRTLDLRVVAKDVGAGVPNVEVVSNLAVGSHLDRRQTSADGTAVIEVEDGGTISILSEVTWIDGTQERVIETFLVTAALTSIVHEVSGITFDRNPPVELVLDMNGTPEAEVYLVELSCGGSLFIDAADLPWVVSDYRGCPGAKMFAASVEAWDAGAHVVGKAAVFDQPLPPDGQAFLTLSPVHVDNQVFSVWFEGLPVGSYAFLQAERRAPDFNYSSWSETETSTPEASVFFNPLLPEVALPIVLEGHAFFDEGDLSLSAHQTLRMTGPNAHTWNPSALARVMLVDGKISFSEGAEPDFGTFSRAGSPELRSASFTFPWRSEAEGTMPVLAPELPEDLQERFGFDGGNIGSGSAVDVHDVQGYEQSLSAGPTSGLTWLNASER